MNKRPCLLILIIIAMLLVGILLVLWLGDELERPKSSYVFVEETYLGDNIPTRPITRDPYLAKGLDYWGISTPGNGSMPVYLNGGWLAHSCDISGGYAYSSILQGCKPYYWGCGNYAFDPIPALEKLYLTISFSKDVVDVYAKDGFAGALVDLWFENFKGDALVVDLYLTRDIKDELGHVRSVGKGFIYAFKERSKFGIVYHFNIVLTEARDNEVLHLDKLLIEPFIDMAFKTFGLNRSEWWLVSVDAGAEAHYAEIYVHLYMLEVGIVAE